MPDILIIGEKRKDRTKLEVLLNNDNFDKKQIKYLSVESGIDNSAFAKASIM